MADNLGLSINKISKETKISRPTLTAMYKNETTGIQFETLETLITFFNVDISDFLYQESKVYDFFIKPSKVNKRCIYACSLVLPSGKKIRFSITSKSIGGPNKFSIILLQLHLVLQQPQEFNEIYTFLNSLDLKGFLDFSLYFLKNAYNEKEQHFTLPSSNENYTLTFLIDDPSSNRIVLVKQMTVSFNKNDLALSLTNEEEKIFYSNKAKFSDNIILHFE